MIVPLTTAERQGHPYARLDLRAIEDPRLSLKATGLLIYLVSKPPGWKICAPQIAKAKRCGVDAVRTGLRELAVAEYLEEVTYRNPDGTIKSRDYVLRELSPSTPALVWMPKPTPNILAPDFPHEDFPPLSNTSTLTFRVNENRFLRIK